MRVVLDTNILVSASLSSRGPSAAILELVLTGSVSLVLSRALFDEYEDVLNRPKFALPSARVAILLDGLSDLGEWVNPSERVSVSPDEDDNRVLECALSGGADVIVTGNSKHFPLAFRGIRILTPRGFLLEVGR